MSNYVLNGVTLSKYEVVNPHLFEIVSLYDKVTDTWKVNKGVNRKLNKNIICIDKGEDVEALQGIALIGNKGYKFDIDNIEHINRFVGVSLVKTDSDTDKIFVAMPYTIIESPKFDFDEVDYGKQLYIDDRSYLTKTIPTADGLIQRVGYIYNNNSIFISSFNTDTEYYGIISAASGDNTIPLRMTIPDNKYICFAQWNNSVGSVMAGNYATIHDKTDSSFVINNPEATNIDVYYYYKILL